MAELDVALDLFLYWLRETHARGFRTDDPDADVISATDGEYSAAIAVRSLAPFDDSAWQERRVRLESAIAEGLPARVALWVPPGADLPPDEPETSEFVTLVQQAAVKLGPHERAHVPLPAVLLLRKNVDSGGVVSATGGLNPHWARFTERVRGSFDLDSTRLHRLPESEEHLEQLIDEVVGRSGQLEVGQIAAIDTIDAWTVQRLSGEGGVTIIGVPPGELGDVGLAVRRNFRRILLDAVPTLRETQADVRALVVLGPYARMEQEGATTALRGYDPASYGGIDFVCLVADGLVKPLIQPPAGLLPWERTTPSKAGL
jgi:hypothetical protein